MGAIARADHQSNC